MTIPSVSSGELIEAAWGNQVATEVNNNVLHRSGGTMTGAIVLNLGPTNDLHAARKSYVDNQITAITDDFLPRSGGSMTGQIQLPGDPTLNAHAARKAYVDAMGDARVRIGGDTMTGVLVVGHVPANGDNGARLTNSGLIAGSTNTVDSPSLTLIRYGGAGAAGQRFVSFQRDRRPGRVRSLSPTPPTSPTTSRRTTGSRSGSGPSATPPSASSVWPAAPTVAQWQGRHPGVRPRQRRRHRRPSPPTP